MYSFNLKVTAFTTLLYFVPLLVFGQSWIPKNDLFIPETGIKDIIVEDAEILYADDATLKLILWEAPDRSENISGSTIILPLLDGETDVFEIIQYPLMEAPLAKKYPNIKAFYGRSITDPYRRVILDYTVHGLRAVISDQEGQIFIDHYQRGDRNHKIVYHRSQFTENDPWTCSTESIDGTNEGGDSQKSVGDCMFKTYRLAQACTGEYSNYHGATSSSQSNLVMSAVSTTLNRVNGVYRQDVNLEMILVANTDQLFYYNPITDPYSGSSVNHLGQNQSNCNAVIGNSNYDVGHVFDTGSGGVASLGSVCSNNNKARGYTGRNTPVGDPFDIDYVAHELGHQFGGNHTQNNSCNRSTNAAREPGSASTIMGYAGICSPNVQSNSDAYFHGYNMLEIANEINTTSCFNVISNPNGEPSVTALSNKTIPRSTPFVLETNVTDPDGDPLLYCWEQWDQEVGTMPPQTTNSQGPMFRSLLPSSDPKRYFPKLDDVINNTTSTWEVLPSVNRNMEFRLTVRDMPMTGGCSDETNVTITTNANAGPFLVTSDNTSNTYEEGTSVNITWNVANTNNAPVSCSNVDILLSYDGGLTYPTTWISNTPNDGSQTLIVPSGVSSTVRYMIKCSDNYFYDINNQDINFIPVQPDYLLSIDSDIGTGCENDTFTVLLSSSVIGAFTDNITLSASNVPNNAFVSFGTNPLPAGGSTQVTIINAGTSAGAFNISIDGQGGNISKSVNYRMTIEPSSNIPSLLIPNDEATYVELQPTLLWSSETNATSYNYRVSTLPNGGNIVASGNTADTTVTLNQDLIKASNYYWSINSVSTCGPSAWSTDRQFSTENCFTISATGLPQTFASNAPTIISSTIYVEENRPILDLNISNFSITHENVGDLTANFQDPSLSNYLLIRSICNGSEDINIEFDNEAASANYPCPPTDGLAYQPRSLFSGIYGMNSRGNYTLNIEDSRSSDGGTFDSWGLDFCLSTDCDLSVTNTNENGTGSLSAAIDCALSGDTILLDATFDNQTFIVPADGFFINKNLTIEATGNNISLNGMENIFTLSDQGSLSLIGFEVASTNPTKPSIDNNGSLILTDMIIGNSLGESIFNQSGQLEILGSTIVK